MSDERTSSQTETTTTDWLPEARREILAALEAVSDRAVAADAEQALSDLLDELERLQESIREGIPDALKRATIGQLLDELIGRGAMSQVRVAVGGDVPGSEAPENPLAAYTDGQLYDELRRRGWVAATWAREEDQE